MILIFIQTILPALWPLRSMNSSLLMILCLNLVQPPVPTASHLDLINSKNYNSPVIKTANILFSNHHLFFPPSTSATTNLSWIYSLTIDLPFDPTNMPSCPWLVIIITPLCVSSSLMPLTSSYWLGKNLPFGYSVSMYLLWE